MLKSFAIKNFRCFRELTLDDLGRVNLIGGRNNLGKTALLEAIHLHCLPNEPEQWVNIHKLRGMEDPLNTLQALETWLFSQGDIDSAIEATSRDLEGIERSTGIKNQGVDLPGGPQSAKNYVQAFLATRKDVQLFLGLAAYRGCWPWGSPAFDGVKDFLKAL